MASGIDVGRIVFWSAGHEEDVMLFRSSSSDWLRWLLMERSKERWTPLDESHTFPRGLGWVELKTQTMQGLSGLVRTACEELFIRLGFAQCLCVRPTAWLHKIHCYVNMSAGRRRNRKTAEGRLVIVCLTWSKRLELSSFVEFLILFFKFLSICLEMSWVLFVSKSSYASRLKHINWIILTWVSWESSTIT